MSEAAAAREHSWGDSGSRCVAVAYDGDTPRLALWLPGGAGASINNAEIELFDRRGLPETAQKDASGNDVVSTVYRNNISLIRQSAKKTDSKYNFYLYNQPLGGAPNPAQVIQLGMTYDPQNPDPTLMVSRQSGSLRGNANAPAWNNASTTWARSVSIERKVARPWLELEKVNSVSGFAESWVRDAGTPVPEGGAVWMEPTNTLYLQRDQEVALTFVLHADDANLAAAVVQVQLNPASVGTLTGETVFSLPSPLPASFTKTIALRLKGTRESEVGLTDKIIFLIGPAIGPGKIFDERILWVLSLGLSVDSNNDGEITSADDAIKMNNPGKLIHLNNDDDDKDGIPDLLESSMPLEDDDLQPIKLTVPLSLVGHGDIRLTVDSGAGVLRVWKGPNKCEEINISNPLPQDILTEAESVLYLEGVSTGAPLVVRLQYALNGSVTWQDQVKVGVIKTQFSALRPGQFQSPQGAELRYGFDDASFQSRPKPRAGDYPSPYQLYPWASVRENDDTAVLVKIDPPEYSEYVHFIPNGQSVVKLEPSAAAPTTPITALTISTGGSMPSYAPPSRSDLPYVQCFLGGASGASGARLMLATYRELLVQPPVYELLLPTATPISLTEPELEDGCNWYLRQAVCRVDLSGYSRLNLDFDSATGQAAAHCAACGGPNNPCPDGDNKLDLYNNVQSSGQEANVFGCEMLWVFAQLYSPPNSVRGDVVVLVKGLQVDGADVVALERPILGVGGTPLMTLYILNLDISENQGTGLYRSAAHELMHGIKTLSGILVWDVGPQCDNDANLMHCSATSDQEIYGHLGYYPVQPTESGTCRTCVVGSNGSPASCDAQWQWELNRSW